MSGPVRIPSFGGWSAIVLHRPHAATDAAARQLQRIGLSVRIVWPDLGPEDAAAHVVLFDADTGHDGQFPWQPGHAPMPLVAMLGSEAPGRIEWAMSQGADAHILKPIGSAGIYSALVIARQNFAARKALLAEVAELRSRLRRRPAVARAMLRLMLTEALDEEAAFRRLRAIAMDLRLSVEDAADALLARNDADDLRQSA